MIINVNGQEREYDDNYSQDYYYIINLIKKLSFVISIFGIFAIIAYIFKIVDELFIFIVPFLFAFFAHIFLFISMTCYYFDFRNLKIGDAVYLKKYYPDVFNRLYYNPYRKIILANYLKTENIYSSNDPIILDILKREKLKKYYLLPFCVCFFSWVINISVIVIMKV
jgi:hypothetical protein